MTNDCSTSLNDWYESEDTVTREECVPILKLIRRFRLAAADDYDDQPEVAQAFRREADALDAAIALLSQPAAQPCPGCNGEGVVCLETDDEQLCTDCRGTGIAAAQQDALRAAEREWLAAYRAYEAGHTRTSYLRWVKASDALRAALAATEAKP